MGFDGVDWVPDLSRGNSSPVLTPESVRTWGTATAPVGDITMVGTAGQGTG